MGLDVYLYSREQQEAANARERAWETYYEKWGEQPDSPEKEAAYQALPSHQGFDAVPSEAHPDHLFNRRYLRSSYNSSGFNAAVPDMVSREHDLHWIFEPVKLDDQYEMELTQASIPALEVARKRALQVADEIRACDPLRVSDEMSTVGEAAHVKEDYAISAEITAEFCEEAIALIREDGSATLHWSG
jgi:hypothetical protein